MKNITIITLIFAIPLLAYMILSKPDASIASKNIDTKKPQILKFTSLMCLDCKKLDKVFKESYPNYSDKITLIEIPVQSETEYTKKQVQKHNITLVPTLVFVTAKGKQLYKTEGFIPKTELEQKMKALINE